MSKRDRLVDDARQEATPLPHAHNRVPLILAAGAVFALCVVHAFRPTGTIGDVSYMVVTVGAGIVALTGARRRPPGERYSWLWIASGVLLSGLGDVIYTSLIWLRGEPSNASLADVCYLSSYVAIAIGLLSIAGMHGRGRRLDIDGLIDMGSFVLLSVILFSQIGDVDEIFEDTSVSRFVQFVWAAYPILDAALFAVLVRSMMTRRRISADAALLSAGIVCWLAADMGAALVTDATAYTVWMDQCWMLGAAAMGAAFLRRPASTPTVTAPSATRVGGARVLISLAPLVAPGAIETWRFAHGDVINPVPLFVASLGLIMLALVRSTRLVAARDQQAADLATSERYYQALAENSADAVMLLDRDGLIKNDSSHLAAMLGRHIELRIGADPLMLLESNERERVGELLGKLRATSGVVGETEVRARHADGSLRWFSLRAVNLAADQAVGGLVVNIHDITDRKEAEGELTHRAFHDSLTGLANRALFHDRVDHALQWSTRTNTTVAIVYLDLDGFKNVNDSRGHECGDNVLREISERLMSAVRPSDTVARLGGDEFAILIEQAAHPFDEATTVADRVLQVLVAPVDVDGQQLVLSASIGIAIADATSTASSMLRDADIAMYRAKTTGKSKWTMYDPEMRAVAIDRMELENDLSMALARHEFRLVYQPIIELESERVIGFEALLRWHHPQRGVIGPDTFIPIAEGNNSIIAIGRWVLEEACRTGAAWRRGHPGRQLTMAVNLSTRQIATPDIVHHVRLALQRSGLEPSALTLEMTETVLVQDATTAARRLHELRALGVKLAIDDFGTGYSSLSYLRQFPVDILKIDRSFINSITDTDEMPAIVRGLLDLGKTLALKTVAEGIELGVQRDSLRDQRCEFGQGFLFAGPLSADEAAAMLDQLAPAPHLIAVNN